MTRIETFDCAINVGARITRAVSSLIIPVRKNRLFNIQFSHFIFFDESSAVTNVRISIVDFYDRDRDCDQVGVIK